MWATGKETANLSNYLYHQILNMPSKVPTSSQSPTPKRGKQHNERLQVERYWGAKSLLTLPELQKLSHKGRLHEFLSQANFLGVTLISPSLEELPHFLLTQQYMAQHLIYTGWFQRIGSQGRHLKELTKYLITKCSNNSQTREKRALSNSIYDHFISFHFMTFPFT